MIKNFGFWKKYFILSGKIWKRVYEVSTIGHEFGHIFLLLMIPKNNESEWFFKNIEEYKATTGGLIIFLS